MILLQKVLISLNNSVRENAYFDIIQIIVIFRANFPFLYFMQLLKAFLEYYNAMHFLRIQESLD